MTGRHDGRSIAGLRLVDGQLAVGGSPLDRLAAASAPRRSSPTTAGCSPSGSRCSGRAAARNRARLRDEGQPDAGGGPAPRPLVDSIDVASALEMRTALDTPMPADQISFAGPGKTDGRDRPGRRCRGPHRDGVEDGGQARADAGERLGVRPRVAVRVNPDFAVKGSGMRMGGGPQQFGVDAEQVPDLLAELASRLDFVGFHVFAGSQNLHAEILCEAQRRTVDLVLEPGRAPRRPGALPEPRWRLRDPLLRQGRAARSCRIAENLAELVDEQIAPQPPGGRR